MTLNPLSALLLIFSTSALRSSPLYKATGVKGDKHLLTAPHPSVLKRALSAFNGQNSVFNKATLTVNDSPVARKLFKDWTLLTSVVQKFRNSVSGFHLV
jgi:hypothetical protein